jgi:hypothetical protein
MKSCPFSKRELLAGILAVDVLACASPGNLFSPGPRPPEVAGVWIDLAKTSYADTVAWVLAPNGNDRTLHIRVKTDEGGSLATVQNEAAYGLWYVSGELADTAKRAICFKKRVRDGATCLRFRIDTVATQPLRRRLSILMYQGSHHRADRFFIDRSP